VYMLYYVADEGVEDFCGIFATREGAERDIRRQYDECLKDDSTMEPFEEWKADCRIDEEEVKT
ncbi:hypothetical protein LCGC14_3153720, partial [marine sediment metagenome]